MNWLFPSFLAGTVLIGLPILLHFLRAKPKSFVPFPSLRFLGETALRDTRRHRLLRWLTLLLRCLVIAGLAAAFARPFWVDTIAVHHQAMVIAIDNSMSMQASLRWAAMRNWAIRQLGELSQGDQAAVLLMHPSPTWLVPMTDDLGRVRSTLQLAEPGFEKTHYSPALRVAGEALASNPSGKKTIVWMADEQRVGWLGADFEHSLPAGVKIRLGEVLPEPKRQAAISSVQYLEGAQASAAVKNGANGGGQGSIVATVRLLSPEKDDRIVTVYDGKYILTQKTVSLHAGDNRVELPLHSSPHADGLRVTLDADNLQADNTAWVSLYKPSKGGVLLDSMAESDFLAHAFLSTQKLGEGGVTPSSLLDKEWPLESVVICRDHSTFSSPGVEHLDRFFDSGGALWIFLDGSSEQIAWLKKRGIQVTERAAADGAWHLRDWDPEHPALSAFAGQSLLPLLDVEFYRGFDLSGDSLSPVANWPDGKTAIAEWSGGGHRILLAGFPLDREATDWPTRSSFVPFVHQAACWLGSFESGKKDWRVGDSIPLPGEGVWRGLDTATAQPECKVNGGSIRASVPGLYEFSSPNTRRVFAVNIPPEESDLAPWPNPEQLARLENPDSKLSKQPRQHPMQASREAAENQQRIWWWLLAFCGAALLIELGLANRTSMS